MSTILVLSNNFSGLVSFRKEVFSALIGHGYTVVIAAPHAVESEIFKNMGCRIIDIYNLNRHGTNPIKDIALYVSYSHLTLPTILRV